MKRDTPHIAAGLVALSLVASAPALADEAEGATSREERPDDSDVDAPVRESNATDRTVSESLPPAERLRRAERAFERGEFERITGILRPSLEPEPAFESESDLIRARELLGVGLFFTAQQATGADRRRQRLEAARQHFLELLRLRPDYSLDSLVFPASVVDLFESVRQKNSEELEEIRRARQSRSDSKGSSEPIYIERNVRKRSYPVNFLPFGLGQFQNGDPIQGSLFAGGQAASLAVVAVGFVAIESLRNENGRFAVDRDGRGDFRRAFVWRRVQWGALGLFGALYAWSIADALAGYDPESVRIRTLDEPPPELRGEGSHSGGPILRVGPGGLRLNW